MSTIKAEFTYANLKFTIEAETVDQVHFHHAEIFSLQWGTNTTEASQTGAPSVDALDNEAPKGSVEIFDQLSLDDRNQWRLHSKRYDQYGVIVVNPRPGWYNLGMGVGDKRPFMQPIRAFVFNGPKGGKRARLDE